jgi:hypothetical protein
LLSASAIHVNSRYSKKWLDNSPKLIDSSKLYLQIVMLIFRRRGKYFSFQKDTVKRHLEVISLKEFLVRQFPRKAVVQG